LDEKGADEQWPRNVKNRVVIAIVVGKRIVTIMNVNTKNDELNMVNITIPI